jgi:hypothetical protein
MSLPQQSPRATTPIFKTKLVLAVILGLIGMIVFFGPTDNWSWDPSFYYAQVRSPIIDRDLDFSNETVTGGKPVINPETGLQESAWPIGPSILWSPFFILAHLIVLLFNPSQGDGFYFPYIALVAIGSIGYGLAGLFITYRAVRYFANWFLSIVATVLGLAATPLFFYTFRQPFMAHTTGLFASALIVFVYLMLAEREGLSKESGLLFGVSLALCFLTRWNGLLLAIVPAIYFFDHFLRSLRQRSRKNLRDLLVQLLVLAGVFILTISPQLSLWYRLDHSFLVIPQSGTAFVDSILPVNLPKIFFDTNRGLIYWSPYVLLGIVGMFFIPDVKVRLMAIISVLSQIVLIGYRVDWYSGGGFGARYFIEFIPFIAIGFVSLLQKLPERINWKPVISIGTAILIAHQMNLMYAVEHGSDGWINLGNYLKGNSVGVRWQLNSVVKLVRDPTLWFARRPYVASDRQTIITNLLSGRLNPKVYFLTGTATIAFLVMMILACLLRKVMKKHNAKNFFLGILAYFFAWSIYLFLVGM